MWTMGRDVAWSAFASSRQQQRPYITEATTFEQILRDCETVVVTKCVHSNDTGSSSSPHPTTEAQTQGPMKSRDHSTTTEASASKSPLDRGPGQKRHHPTEAPARNVTTRPRLRPETSTPDRGSGQKRQHPTEAQARNVNTRPRPRPETSPLDRGITPETSPLDRGSGQQVTTRPRLRPASHYWTEASASKSLLDRGFGQQVTTGPRLRPASHQ
jgi:hypothetical protein